MCRSSEPIVAPGSGLAGPSNGWRSSARSPHARTCWSVVRSAAAGRGAAGTQLLSGGEDIDLEAEVDLIMERLGLNAVGDVRAGQLPTGQARLVELGRALAARPKLLLLDEPASGLDENETERFGTLLRELAVAGLGILLVEHDVALVMATCTQISVLDFGQIIASGSPDVIRRSDAVQSAYLGAA